MHTEPEIRRAIKPIIEKYGQLNTTELKSILAEYIEYDEEDLKELLPILMKEVNIDLRNYEEYMCDSDFNRRDSRWI